MNKKELQQLEDRLNEYSDFQTVLHILLDFELVVQVPIIDYWKVQKFNITKEYTSYFNDDMLFSITFFFTDETIIETWNDLRSANIKNVVISC